MPDTWFYSEVILDVIVAALIVVLIAESRVQATVPFLFEITFVGAEVPFSDSTGVAGILFVLLIILLISSVTPVLLRSLVDIKEQMRKLRQ